MKTNQYKIKESETLGLILVSLNEKNEVNAVLFDTEKETLKNKLYQLFPNDNFKENTTNQIYDEVFNYIEKPLSEHSFSLDLNGTEFQKKVWKEITNIPTGETCSYTDLAIRIGQPTSARAVATACAKNKIAVLIPCHRVLNNTGKNTGYRWGLGVKDILLSIEKQ